MNKYRIENPNNKDVREYKSRTTGVTQKNQLIMMEHGLFITKVKKWKDLAENQNHYLIIQTKQ